MTIFLALWLTIMLVILAGTVFWIIALVDCARREFTGSNDKIVWVLIVLLGSLIGALVYWFVGRPKGVNST